MGTKVNIMDMQVDLLTKETLKQEMQNFLENETVNVAHVISSRFEAIRPSPISRDCGAGPRRSRV